MDICWFLRRSHREEERKGILSAAGAALDKFEKKKQAESGLRRAPNSISQTCRSHMLLFKGYIKAYSIYIIKYIYTIYVLYIYYNI